MATEVTTIDCFCSWLRETDGVFLGQFHSEPRAPQQARPPETGADRHVVGSLDVTVWLGEGTMGPALWRGNPVLQPLGLACGCPELFGTP